MKRIFWVLLFFLLAQAAGAQTADERRGWGYAFAGAGGRTGDFGEPVIQVGAGGEALVRGGFGVGAELGYLTPTDDFGNGFGVLSPNISYHFARGGKVSPFVTGGYSLAFSEGSASGGNFGGGVHVWMNERLGLRFEVRNHVFSSDSPHTVVARFGITFR